MPLPTRPEGAQKARRRQAAQVGVGLSRVRRPVAAFRARRAVPPPAGSGGGRIRRGAPAGHYPGLRGGLAPLCARPAVRILLQPRQAQALHRWMSFCCGCWILGRIASA